MNIFVGNLSFETQGADLQKLFEGFGSVTSAVIVMRKEKRAPKSRGFGFVDMPDEAQALAAIAGLNGKEFMGRALTVNVVLPKTELKAVSKPKAAVEGEQHPDKEKEEKRAWSKPIIRRPGTYKGGRRSVSYMKRKGLTEMPVESKPRRGYKDNPMRWRKRSEQPKPWQKTPGEHKPWQAAGEGGGFRNKPEAGAKPWKRAEEGSRPWKKAEEGARPWKKTEEGPKPWRRPEEGARPWKKTGAEGRTWNKPGESPKPWDKSRTGAKPWSKRTDQPKPWQKTSGEYKPWKKSEEPGGFRNKFEAGAKPWKRAEEGSKPWKKPEAGARPWKKAGVEIRTWNKPGEKPKPWNKSRVDVKPWSKSSARPEGSRFHAPTSGFDKFRAAPERAEGARTRTKPRRKQQRGHKR